MRVDRKPPSTARLLFDFLTTMAGGICLLWGMWQGLGQRHYAEATYFLVLFMVSGLGWNREH